MVPEFSSGGPFSRFRNGAGRFEMGGPGGLFVWIFAPVIIFILIKLILNINSKNLMRIYLKTLLLGKRKKLGILKSDTLEEIYNKFSETEKNKYRQFFQAFEINKYSRKNFGIIETLRLIF